MTHPKKLDMYPQGDRDVVMARTFDAPRPMVFAAWTKPEHLKKWMLGPPGWTLVVCEVDLRVGGSYRYVWHSEIKGEMGMGGIHREIVVPERIVATEIFDHAWYEGEAVSTTLFVEKGEQTLVTNTMNYVSKAVRDGILQSNLESGVAASYDRLDDVLAALRVG